MGKKGVKDLFENYEENDSYSRIKVMSVTVSIEQDLWVFQDKDFFLKKHSEDILDFSSKGDTEIDLKEKIEGLSLDCYLYGLRFLLFKDSVDKLFFLLSHEHRIDELENREHYVL